MARACRIDAGIDRRGRRFRLGVGGVLILLGVISLGVAVPAASPWRWIVPAGLVALGAFNLYEGFAGW
jgi:hypothetical protein